MNTLGATASAKLARRDNILRQRASASGSGGGSAAASSASGSGGGSGFAAASSAVGGGGGSGFAAASSAVGGGGGSGFAAAPAVGGGGGDSGSDFVANMLAAFGGGVHDAVKEAVSSTIADYVQEATKTIAHQKAEAMNMQNENIMAARFIEQQQQLLDKRQAHLLDQEVELAAERRQNQRDKEENEFARLALEVETERICNRLSAHAVRLDVDKKRKRPGKDGYDGDDDVDVDACDEDGAASDEVGAACDEDGAPRAGKKRRTTKPGRRGRPARRSEAAARGFDQSLDVQRLASKDLVLF